MNDYLNVVENMIRLKTPQGYNENDFTKDYWLAILVPGTARINRGYGSTINYWKDLFKRANIQGKLLDVGAGTGNVVKGLLKLGIDAKGCEFSSSGRKLAGERFNILLKECDLRKELPYENEEFNWSMCIGVLSMIPKGSMKNAISEILRVTKYGVLIHVLTKVVNTNVKDGYYGKNPHHITSMTSQEYWKLLNECGAFDWTSIQPPQKVAYGIGIRDEFTGLFSKRKWDL